MPPYPNIRWAVSAEARSGYDSDRIFDLFVDFESAEKRALELTEDADEYADVALWKLHTIGQVTAQLVIVKDDDDDA